MFFISLGMVNNEIGSVIPEAGGQYAMAKYLLGPLAAFNAGLMLVFEIVMLVMDFISYQLTDDSILFVGRYSGGFAILVLSGLEVHSVVNRKNPVRDCRYQG